MTTASSWTLDGLTADTNETSVTDAVTSLWRGEEEERKEKKEGGKKEEKKCQQKSLKQKKNKKKK